MKGILRLSESVSVPRQQYDGLVNIAQSLLWASETAPRVSFPGANGYLVYAADWERMLSHLAPLVTTLEVVTPADAEEQTA